MADANAELALMLSANIAQFQKQMALLGPITDKAAKRVEDRLKQHKVSVNKLFGEAELGKAINSTFSRSRFAVLEEGAAKIPIFGSALEELGPAGLAAAAGVAAVATAMEQAKQAAEWAEGVERSAKALGITTTALQEFDFVADATGIPVEKMRAALDGLNQQVGRVEDGIARGNVKKAFAALDLDPQQLRNLGDLEHILPVIVEHAAKLTATQRAGISEALRIPPDVLDALIESKGELGELIEQAHKYGVIADEDLIRKSAAAAEQMHVASAVIDKEMKVAFASLAPLAADAATAIAKAAVAIGDVVRQSQDAIEPIARLIGQFSHFPSIKLPSFSSLPYGAAANAIGQGGATLWKGLVDQGRADEMKDRIAKMLAGGKVDLPEDGKPHGVNALVDDSKKGPKVHDDSDERIKAAADALDTGTKNYLDAQARLTGSVQAHADAEKAAIDQDLAKRGLELQAQLDKIAADKSLSAAKKQQLVAEIGLARLGEQSAAQAKKDLIDRQAAQKLQQQELTKRASINDAYDQIDRIKAGEAATAAQRLKFELDALDHEQADAYAKRKAELDAELAGLSGSELQAAASNAAAQLASLRDLQAAQRAQLIGQNRSPGQQFAFGLNQQAAGFADQLESVQVKGIEGLGDALDKLILKTGKAREVWHQFALSIATDLLKLATKSLVEAPLANLMFPGQGGGQIGGAAASSTALTGLAGSATAAAMALQQIVVSAPGAPGLGGIGSGASPGLIGSLINLLPHFADGTSDAGGGWSEVGEDGPELVNMNPGAQVISNRDLIGGLGSTNPASLARGPANLNVHTHIDLTGANGDETIRRIAYQAAAQGSARAVAIARAVIPNDLNARSRQNLTGRN